jgi:pyruvate/2-oxoglutarate dehydrogenase complex dihydrolipoamide dehydrogenase (E3) component
MEAAGITLHLNAKAEKAEGDTLHYSQDGKENKLQDTAILVAVGRKANTQGLGLENTDVRLTDRGLIEVDDHLQTAAKGIWALGDVCSKMQFT